MTMNYDKAIKNLNRSIFKRRPLTINPSWVKNCVRKSYNFIVENVQAESGEPDWDKIIRNLEHDYQKLWHKGIKRKKKVIEYENHFEVKAIENKYKEKLYTFLIQQNGDDKRACDEIAIRLVRTAQKGNTLAKQRALFLIKQLVDCWIENNGLRHWRGYTDLIDQNIDRCIRRYRHSGSFLVYLYRTLEYSGRGLKSLEAFSLDECSPITEKRKSESLIYDPTSGETRLFSRKSINP